MLSPRRGQLCVVELLPSPGDALPSPSWQPPPPLGCRRVHAHACLCCQSPEQAALTLAPSVRPSARQRRFQQNAKNESLYAFGVRVRAAAGGRRCCWTDTSARIYSAPPSPLQDLYHLILRRTKRAGGRAVRRLGGWTSGRVGRDPGSSGIQMMHHHPPSGFRRGNIAPYRNSPSSVLARVRVRAGERAPRTP